MSDKTKEPIDLQKRREEKRRKQDVNETKGQPPWPGSKFVDKAETIQFTEELLERIKIMISAISSKVKEAQTLDDVERPCFGLALLLLRDIDAKAYERLFTLVKEKMEEKNNS